MSNLSVFKMVDWNWKRPKNNFRNIKKIVKYSWQRITKGYCNYDLYDIDWYLIWLLPSMLENFAEKTNSYPAEFDNIDTWKENIRHIADRFKTAEDFYNLSDSLEDHTAQQRIDFYDKSVYCLKQGFELLIKYYWHLWD